MGAAERRRARPPRRSDGRGGAARVDQPVASQERGRPAGARPIYNERALELRHRQRRVASAARPARRARWSSSTASGKRFSGRYYVTSRPHTYRPSAATAPTFTVQEERLVMSQSLLDLLHPRATPHATASTAWSSGIVTNNQDPDELGPRQGALPVAVGRRRELVGADRHADGRQRPRALLPARGRRRGAGRLRARRRRASRTCSARSGTARTSRRRRNDDGKNNLRVIKSRSGHVIRLDDTDGKREDRDRRRERQEQHRHRHRNEHDHDHRRRRHRDQVRRTARSCSTGKKGVEITLHGRA